MARRRFSRTQRIVLALSGFGRCQRCGRDLEPGWHADHVVPYSRGGATELVNGQALCPGCNLLKGSTLTVDSFQPRRFQRELVAAVMARVTAGEQVTVANVAAGSGKALGAQMVATELIRRGYIDCSATYVPRVSLATQTEVCYRREEVVAGDLVDVGDYELFETPRLEKIRHVSNNYPLLPPDSRHEGFVTCYASLTKQPDLHLDWARRNEGRFLLVADEAQFCGASDDNASGGTKAGQCIEQMARYARHTLLLTGTPYRADGGKLVLTDYLADDAGRQRLVAHVEARYRDGIGARPEPYLRRFEMTLTTMGVRLENNLKRRAFESDTADPELYRYMNSIKPALREESVWQDVLDRTVSRLQFMQRINPGYRALVACMEQREARQAQAYLRERYPQLRVALALSDDGVEAETALRKFRVEPADILVTVRMAFLGYDCPQITVVGVLTNYRNHGHLMQLVFRGGRVWDAKVSGHPARDQCLHIISTDDPKMRQFLDYLRTEQDAGLALTPNGTGNGGGGSGGSNPWVVADAYPMTTTIESDTVTVSDFERQQYEALLERYGPITSVAQMAAVGEELRRIGLGVPTDSGSAAPPRAPRPEKDIVKRCKSEASGYIGSYLKQQGHETSDHNYRLVRQRVTTAINQAFGVRSTEVITTKERAREYLAHVKRWVTEQ